jgi:hypothetical protein
MTLTGLLWFGAGVTEYLPVEIRFLLLFFAGLCNQALVLAALRIRDLLENYLEKIKEFHPKSFALGKPANPDLPWLGSYGMISVYCVLMLIGGVFSFILAFWKHWPSDTGLWVCIVVCPTVLIAIYLILFRPGSVLFGKHGAR